MATGATGFQGFMRDNAGTLSLFGNGLNLVGSGLSAINQYSAGKAQKAAAYATAGNIRQQAQGAYDAGLADEYLQRMNQNADASTARAVQGGSGFLASGTGDANELTMMKQYQLEIGQQASRRENERRSANYQAAVQEWQGRVAARSAKRGALGTVLGAVAGTALAMTGFGMAAVPALAAGMAAQK